MTRFRTIVLLLGLLLVGPSALQAQPAPKLLSLFPLAGQRGTTVDVEIRGAGLEGSSVVWLGPNSKLDSLKAPSPPQPAILCTKSPDGLTAHVQGVADGSRLKVRLAIAADARIGVHTLSLISPRGLSGPLSFWVSPHPVIEESATPHNTVDAAQTIKVPVVINGHISAEGQLDYYTFEINREQKLAFEVLSWSGGPTEAHLAIVPQLSLQEAGGSFLDPRQSKRLLFHEEITQGSLPANRRMTYQFTRPGRYLVSFGNRFARGKVSDPYLLRIAPADESTPPEDALSWGRRRLQEIRSRAIGAPAGDVTLVREGNPNDLPKLFALPAILEGTIGQPGDIDQFRFKAKAGQKLVFEVQTPRASPPQFNLRLDVLDAKKNVVLSNLHVHTGMLGTVDAKMIRLAPEMVGKLDAEGEYTLRIRDLTSIHGSPDHVYRVLVRPQIPHIGDIRIQPEGPVNLAPGGRQRLTLNASFKEGYAGTLALSVEGLPQGVKAFVGMNGTTIELIVDASAPGTPLPRILRIAGLSIVEGKPGSAFPVAEVPFMVLKK